MGFALYIIFIGLMINRLLFQSVDHLLDQRGSDSGTTMPGA